ncbi:hypothetical protein MCOR25_001703 [Pyricularia grisea]|nr:hypothetical protein MCOR25_001703 [Pyricularia grisea]
MSTDSLASYKTAYEHIDVDHRTASSTSNQGHTSPNKVSFLPSTYERQVIKMPKENRWNRLSSSRLKINSQISERQEPAYHRQDEIFARMKKQVLKEIKKANQWRQRLNYVLAEKKDLDFELKRCQTGLHDGRKLIADLERMVRELTNNKAELGHKVVDSNRRYEESREIIEQQNETINDQRLRNIALEDQVIDYENKHNDDQILAQTSQQNIDYLVSQLEKRVDDLDQTRDQLMTQGVTIDQQKESITNLEDQLRRLCIQLDRAQGVVAIRDADIAEQQESITSYQDQVRHLSVQLEDFQDQVSRRNQCIAEHKEKIGQLAQDLNNAETEMARTKAQQQQLEENLTQREAQGVELQRVIAEQKQLIEEIRQADFESVVADVSNELPDSEIRSKFGELLGTEVDDWCMEYKVQKLKMTGALQNLLCCGEDRVVWQEQDTPDNLRLRIDNPKAPVIMLQAALSAFLCKHFLQDPFFLLKLNCGEAAVDGQLAKLKAEHTALTTFLKECKSSKASAPESHSMGLSDLVFFLETAELHWRTATVELLEGRLDLNMGMSRDVAKAFVDDYQALLMQQSSDMLEELSVIILNFVRFCLRLWKRKVPIYVGNNRDIGGQRFKANSDWWDVTPLIGLDHGDKSLDGRPMCVIIKPLIFTMSAASDSKEIIWSKASVWVSNESAGIPITIDI